MKKFRFICFLFIMIISLGILCFCDKEHVHEWTEISKTTATCTEDGVITYLCNKCDESNVVVVKQATGHKEVIDKAVAPTCNETGLTEGRHCSVCNAVLVAQETVAALGHLHSTDWFKDASGHWHACDCGDIVEKTSHTSSGPATEEADEVCTVCGYVIAPKLNHEHTYNMKVENEDTLKEEATCIKNAVYYYSCHCGKISAELTYEKKDSASGHTHAEAVKENEVLSTCKVEGIYELVVYCSECKEELSRETVSLPLAEHTEETVLGKQPTCTQPGLTEGKKCSECNEVIAAQEVVPALDHDYKWIVDKEATVLEPGLKHEECTRCDSLRNENTVIDILICSHNLQKIDATNATCTENGNVEYYHCLECFKNYSDSAGCLLIEDNSWIIKAQGHKEVIDVAVAATCMKAGLTEGRHCAVCEKVLVAQEEIAKLGHHYGNVSYTWDDDYTKVTATRVCMNDSEHIEEETINATFEIIDEATCIKDGLIRYTSEKFENEAFSIQKKDVVLTALGHKEIQHKGKEATCYQNGYNDYVTCERCDYSTFEEIVSTGHKYTVEKLNPTCTEKGYTIYTCFCGDTYTDDFVDELGHDNDLACSRCGEKFYTEGLEYSFSTNTCYVKGIGNAKDNEIIIPSEYNGYKVVGIYSGAFKDCTNITSIVIPSSVTNIGSGILSGCINLNSITIPYTGQSLNGETNKHFGYIFGASSYENQKDYVPASLKNVIILSETSLADECFSGCSNIVSITLPDNFEYLGEYALSGCDNLTGIEYDNAIYMGTTNNPYMILLRAKNKNITNCKINDNTIFISSYAFSGCNMMQSVEIPGSVRYISRFGGYYLKEVYYKGTIEDWCNIKFPVIYYDGCSPMIDAESFYMLNDNNIYYEVTEITIPDTITSINSHQFIGFSNVTKITLPNTIEYIGNSAFEDCINLLEIEIPGSVKYIGFDAFRDCHKLEKIIFNVGLEHIDDYAFSNCYSLQEAILPEGINHIGFGAFEACGELKRLYIPKGTKEIVPAILHRCNKIEYINVPYFSNEYNYDGAYLGMMFFAPSADTQDDYIPATLKEVIVTNEDKFHNYAFYGCNNLESLTLPFIGGEKDHNKNSYLGYVFGAPSYSSQNSYIPNTLKKVVFTDGNIISEYSFYNCSSIEIIEIPNTVKKFCVNAFNNINLHTVYFNGTIEEWFEIEFETTPMHYADNLYFKNENGEYYVPTEVVVPDTITNLSYQLYGINSLVSVTIPDTVTNIMYSALYKCNNLESLTTPFIKSVGTDFSSTKYNFIGGLFGAYQYKDNGTYVPSTLKNVVITNQAELDSYAFYGCSSITNIELPTNLTKIGNSAFYNCSSLESIVIPDSVTDLGEYAFYDCVNLEYIKLSENITEIKYSTFDGCSSLEYINLPDKISKIGTYAFYYCNKLNEIKFPANLTTLGNYAFEKCSALKDICINDKITSIGNKAFSGCSKITNIYYNGSIENWSKITMTSSTSNPMYYGDNLYIKDDDGVIEYGEQKYSLITSLVIPEDITIIKAYFVVGNTLDSVFIHENVLTIEKSAFYNCDNIKIYCEAPIKPAGWVSSWCPSSVSVYWGVNSDSIAEIDGLEYIIVNENEVCLMSYNGEETELVIPNTIEIKDTAYNVTQFDQSVFKDCVNLESIVLPNTLTTISENCFYNCSSLKSIVIPNSVIEIGDFAFYKCSSLESVIISDSITEIGEYVFSGCNNLKNITLPFIGDKLNESTNAYLGYLFGAPAYTYNQSSVPTTLEEVNITGGTSIYENAFYGCSSLKSITLPNTLTIIGDKSFYNCSNIENIVIPNSVTNLGSGAFYGCNSLTSITLPFVGNTLNGTTNTHFGYIFGANTYASNSYNVPSSLKEVVVTKGTNISNDAFHGCDDITSVTLPNTVTSIGEYAFYGCSSMTNITLPDKLTTIGKNAFYNCSNIENVVIPNTVTSIDEWAFCGCSKLEWVVIFDSLTDMASYVFYNCKNLKIYIKADSIPVNWASNWNTSGLPVYLKGQWEYDSNGNPIPLS